MAGCLVVGWLVVGWQVAAAGATFGLLHLPEIENHFVSGNGLGGMPWFFTFLLVERMLGQFASQVGGKMSNALPYLCSNVRFNNDFWRNVIVSAVARARIEGLLRSLGAPLEPLGWPWERRGVLGGPHGGPGWASERFWRSLRALGSILLKSNEWKSLIFIMFFDNSCFWIIFQENYVQRDCTI